MRADTQNLLDEATTHLHAAAHLARGDGTSPGRHLAGLIRLTSAGIQPSSLIDPDADAVDGTVAGRLRAALAALDSIDPLDGPPDLLAWSAGVADLLRLASRDEAAQP